MTLKERVKELCDENNVKSYQLEEYCGFAKGYLSKLDHPNVDKVNAIAEYFGVSLDYLVNGKEDRLEKYANMSAKLMKDEELTCSLKKYFNLSDAKKKHVIELINLLSEE